MRKQQKHQAMDVDYEGEAVGLAGEMQTILPKHDYYTDFVDVLDNWLKQ